MNEANKNQGVRDLAIVVNSCDAYSDVLELFFAALQDQWPDCPYPIVINTENNNYERFPATVHNSGAKGADKWGERLRGTLQSTSSEFVLMLCDDFILEAAVSLEGLESALDLLQGDETSAVVYLINTSLPVVEPGDSNMYLEVRDGSDYRLNSAPGIWRKRDLLNYTEPNDNPWAWEVFGSYRTYRDGKSFYTLNPKFTDVYPYDYRKGGAIYRGKWVRSVVLGMFDKYELDVDPLLRGYSEEGSYEPRSLWWKLSFMATGYRMVGLKSLLFVYRYMREKING